MSKKDLLMKALEELRVDLIRLRDAAAHPGPYMDPEDYDIESGKEFAYDEAVYRLNKIIQGDK